MYAYEFNGYWKDVGTLTSYWEANMELIDVVPEFNLYEEYWKIYTKSEILPPQYVAEGGVIERSIVGEGSEIYGQVYNSVIGCGVTIWKDTVVRDSIIMNNTEIGASCELNKAIIAENTGWVMTSDWASGRKHRTILHRIFTATVLSLLVRRALCLPRYL